MTGAMLLAHSSITPGRMSRVLDQVGANLIGAGVSVGTLLDLATEN